MYTIEPYKDWDGTWVFDDPAREIVKEPLILGTDKLLDFIVSMLCPDNERLKVHFSSKPIRWGFAAKYVRPGCDEGAWYSFGGFQFWLCDTLKQYFAEPPSKLYVSVEF